jgi:hypothetical protein
MGTTVSRAIGGQGLNPDGRDTRVPPWIADSRCCPGGTRWLVWLLDGAPPWRESTHHLIGLAALG